MVFISPALYFRLEKPPFHSEQKAGETLRSIARSYNVSPRTIQRLDSEA